ncbi:hypothetical protein VDG1235_1223 [Verrucomicrobiia bacterium DG1235]|nr:hypothetical protein VDG1235_1223 [Verrucomicrobiae bacterium DG1235]
MQALDVRWKSYPIVTITGPRQSGKTTLARAHFPDLPYQTLENPDTRAFAQEDPKGFLNQHPEGAILDEIQNTPELLSYLQGIVDEDNRPGQYVLTGSHNFNLLQTVSQSLSGRTSLLTLLPLSLSETSQAAARTIDEHIHTGFYPRLHQANAPEPYVYYADYFQTYVQRDIRSQANIRDNAQFERFIRLCAGRVGQLLNITSLANDVGISRITAENWLTFLETSYLCYRLQPYHANLGKRLTKSPKLYFYDVGLASYLIGIKTADQIATHPLRGELFENLIISDFHKQFHNAGDVPQLYFYRDLQGTEIDCVFPSANSTHLIEIKSGQTISSDQYKALFKVPPLAQHAENKRYLVHTGEQTQHRSELTILNLQDASTLYS